MALEWADLKYVSVAAFMVILFDLKYVSVAAFMSMKKRLTKEIEALGGTVEEFNETLKKKLASLSLKVEEHSKTSKLISDDVTKVINSQTSQLECDLQELTEIMSGIEAKLGILESKQNDDILEMQAIMSRLRQD